MSHTLADTKDLKSMRSVKAGGRIHSVCEAGMSSIRTAIHHCEIMMHVLENTIILNRGENFPFFNKVHIESEDPLL